MNQKVCDECGAAMTPASVHTDSGDELWWLCDECNNAVDYDGTLTDDEWARAYDDVMQAVRDFGLGLAWADEEASGE